MRRAILVLSASVLITSFMPASAATGSALDPVPIPGVGSLLELEVSSGFVFVGDQNGTTIVVFDHQLNLVGTLTGLVSLQDLMIKDDVMYVTSHGADRIDVFDLSTPFPFMHTSIATAPLVDPNQVAWAGGELWVTGFHDGLSAIANVDQAGSVTVHDGNYSALHIRSSATDPNALILVSTMMQRLSVAGGSPVLQASSPLAAIPSFAEWSADGQRFVISAVGADLGAWEFDPVSLTKTQAEYRTSVFARAGAVYPDSSRLVLAADRTDHQSGVELHVYRFSDGEKILRLLLDVNMPAADDGLRFSPDGSAMFLLLGGGMGPALLALPGDPRQGEISIDAPDAVPYGSSVVVDLHLNAESDNRTVRVYVRPAGGDKELVADRSVGSGGDLRVRLTDLRADSTVTVEWDGDGRFLPLESKRIIRVRSIIEAALLGGFDDAGRYRLFRSGDHPAFAVHVTPNLQGTFVEFELQKFVDGRWKRQDFLGFKLNRRSEAAAIVTNPKRGLRYRINAIVDPTNELSASESDWAYFRVV